MYLVDTNIFIELLLDQQHADECAVLLESFHNGELSAYVSSFTLHSIEVILERAKKLDVLKSFLQDIHESKGLKRFDTNTIEEMFAVEPAIPVLV